MNDNIEIEGHHHAAALSLLNDLMLILRNMEHDGLDRVSASGERVYQPWFWANECAKVLGVTPPFVGGNMSVEASHVAG